MVSADPVTAVVTRRYPDWLRAAMPGRSSYPETHQLLRSLGLATVCEEARCPNIGECYANRTATFMILGSTCTRACAFCAVDRGNPGGSPPPGDEPERVARAVAELGLNHVVITSVTRDDLPDRGAGHYSACVEQVKAACPSVRVEVLIPDFGGSVECLATVVCSGVDILNHNVETVPRCIPRFARRPATAGR